MKQILLSKKLFILALSLFILNGWGQVTTFDFTGSMQTFVVPDGVYSLGIDIRGAAGGNSSDGSHSVGRGGRIQTTLAVTPGSTLNIFVGGEGQTGVFDVRSLGGWNGGGNSGLGFGSFSGGGGGGASDIRIGGTGLADRVLVAGGGGGTADNFPSGDNGGDGGGLTGEQGYSEGFASTKAGKGGSQFAGGTYGFYVGFEDASPGTLGNGGNAGSDGSGGGGGGGGAWAGGGGGSDFVNLALCTSTSSTQGYNSGNGQVIITELCTDISVTISDYEICLGESVNLFGEGFGDISWDGGISNGIDFTPASTGTFTYNATSDEDVDCPVSVSIEVFNPITISSTTNDELFGGDGAINITVSGGNPSYSFDWDNDGAGDFDDSEDLADLTGGTYTVIVNDEAGCSASEVINVDSQLGIDSNAEQTFSLYPNPTADQITISSEGNFAYQLVAINGEVIANGTGFNQTTLSLKDLADGIYFVTLTANNSTNTVKVIKL